MQERRWNRYNESTHLHRLYPGAGWQRLLGQGTAVGSVEGEQVSIYFWCERHVGMEWWTYACKDGLLVRSVCADARKVSTEGRSSV